MVALLRLGGVTNDTLTSDVLIAASSFLQLMPVMSNAAMSDDKSNLDSCIFL